MWVLPAYNVANGDRVVILDEFQGDGSPPTVDAARGIIQFHVNIWRWTCWTGGSGGAPREAARATCCLRTLQAVCGNETAEFPELCDGSDLAGYECTDFSFYGGTLSCLSDCTNFDHSGCSGFYGDNSTNGPEVCDGADLGNQTCQARGFYGGTLACRSDCSDFDTSGCSGRCGDNTVNGSEACDGADLNGNDCGDLGLYGGTLGCLPDCSDFDTGGCITVPVVKINELSHGFPDWVELVNLSLIAVNLQNWVLDTWGYYNGNPELQQLTLPAYNLDPGDRVVILDQINGNGSPPTVDQAAGTIQFHVNVSWGNNPGAAALIDNNGQPLDFVRWGGPNGNCL